MSPEARRPPTLADGRLRNSRRAAARRLAALAFKAEPLTTVQGGASTSRRSNGTDPACLAALTARPATYATDRRLPLRMGSSSPTGGPSRLVVAELEPPAEGILRRVMVKRYGGSHEEDWRCWVV